MSGVIIDTCIWSLALRGKTARDVTVANTLADLIESGQAKILGPIRQEVLSGYSDVSRFEKLREKLDSFPNERIEDADYVTAAAFSNRCRSKGVQGSHIDFLICAIAVRLKIKIYTTDKDFSFYSQHLPIELLDSAQS